MSDFRIDKPFDTRPPRLKDLINGHVMGDVWIRDTPFGPVTDSLKIAELFDMQHKHLLRAIDKCIEELSIEPKFGLNENFIENRYLGGAKGKERKLRKVDITEFGLTLLLLYINTPKARIISAEILYRFFILKTYLDGLNENQIGALKGYYRKQMKEKVSANVTITHHKKPSLRIRLFCFLQTKNFIYFFSGPSIPRAKIDSILFVFVKEVSKLY